MYKNEGGFINAGENVSTKSHKNDTKKTAYEEVQVLFTSGNVKAGQKISLSDMQLCD
jgi:hypothetical protein